MWGSEVANYKTEIHIAKYNRRGDVVMQCHRRRAREGQVQLYKTRPFSILFFLFTGGRRRSCLTWVASAPVSWWQLRTERPPPTRWPPYRSAASFSSPRARWVTCSLQIFFPTSIYGYYSCTFSLSPSLFLAQYLSVLDEKRRA